MYLDIRSIHMGFEIIYKLLMDGTLIVFRECIDQHDDNKLKANRDVL